MGETRYQLPKADMLGTRASLGTQIQERMGCYSRHPAPHPGARKASRVKQPSSVIAGPCPHRESRGLSHPDETVAMEAPLPFPSVALQPCRASSPRRASATSSPDPTFSNSPGCSSHGLGRATASSNCEPVARGHVCPERSSSRSWFLPTSRILEP